MWIRTGKFTVNLRLVACVSEDLVDRCGPSGPVRVPRLRLYLPVAHPEPQVIDIIGQQVEQVKGHLDALVQEAA